MIIITDKDGASLSRNRKGNNQIGRSGAPQHWVVLRQTAAKQVAGLAWGLDWKRSKPAFVWLGNGTKTARGAGPDPNRKRGREQKKTTKQNQQKAASFLVFRRWLNAAACSLSLCEQRVAEIRAAVEVENNGPRAAPPPSNPVAFRVLHASAHAGRSRLGHVRRSLCRWVAAVTSGRRSPSIELIDRSAGFSLSFGVLGAEDWGLSPTSVPCPRLGSPRTGEVCPAESFWHILTSRTHSSRGTALAPLPL